MTATTPLPNAGEPMTHYVSAAPFDPYSIEGMTEEQERVFKASPRRNLVRQRLVDRGQLSDEVIHRATQARDFLGGRFA